MSFLQKLISFFKPKKNRTFYYNEADMSTYPHYHADSNTNSFDHTTPALLPDMEQPTYDSSDFSIDSTDSGFDGGFDGGDSGAD